MNRGVIAPWSLDLLPPRQAEIVRLRFFEGSRPKDIAAQTSLAATSVSVEVFRGLRHLRARLEDDDGFL